MLEQEPLQDINADLDISSLSLEPSENLQPVISDSITEVESDVFSVDNPVTQPERISWLRKNYTNLLLGGLALGGLAYQVASPDKHIVSEIKQDAWVGPAWLCTEAFWLGGAAMMATAVGTRVGNPLTLKKRFQEFKDEANQSALYRSGLVINTTGAVALGGVLVAGTLNLPESLWPTGLALVAADAASTVAIRAPLYASMAKTAKKAELTDTPEKHKVKIRHAELGDMSNLADLDLKLFRRAYGDSPPSHEEVEQTFTRRYMNSPDYMFVAEMNGRIAGFVSAFRTDVPVEDFVSWEHSTANGTLDGKVVPDGKYAYVTNMTIEHAAVKNGAEDMLLANLFANAIRDKVEYGYFVSRIPTFSRWLRKHNIDAQSVSKDELIKIATDYANSRNEKGLRVDPQLAMYEKYGYSLGEVVADGFEDKASVNFAVTCKADVPPKRKIFSKIPPIRYALSIGLRTLAKSPKLLEKAF